MDLYKYYFDIWWRREIKIIQDIIQAMRIFSVLNCTIIQLII